MFHEYNINNMDSLYSFKRDLSNIIYPLINKDKLIIFYFIGTDRCTGDSMGPFAGDRFKGLIFNNILFFGSLENPVHAANINNLVKKNEVLYKNSLTIAIDASLGTKSNIGNVILQNKPVKPGSALNKSIKAIGDYSITGIVNYFDNLDFLVLQNTRLYNVLKLSNFISEGIYKSLMENSKIKKAL